jgi:hypothetical protein
VIHDQGHPPHNVVIQNYRAVHQPRGHYGFSTWCVCGSYSCTHGADSIHVQYAEPGLAFLNRFFRLEFYYPLPNPANPINCPPDLHRNRIIRY